MGASRTKIGLFPVSRMLYCRSIVLHLLRFQLSRPRGRS